MTTTTTATAPRRSAEHTRALILATLTEAPEPVTVAALAEETGLGASTLAKHLNTLEEEKKTVRTPGGRQGNKRLPDTWHATPAPEPASPQETTELAPATTPKQKNPAPSPEERNETGTVSGTGERPRTAPAAEPATSKAAFIEVGAPNPVSGSPRLAPGELKVMVKALLDASPKEEFTATEISHLLAGRSIGAIQNNLARLAKEGRAAQTGDKPRRYRSAKSGN
ncbi:helix-turn-helix domain-containing protein [Nocardiopsis changdeensis]|uniref:Winged helix-turn-helix transcriptional regulator n=1 Tax=Nocardiopsis changdeensis TaxID=2831969 RepID=A0ABX8BPJ8_9ACTN|nr:MULTISPECIES: winged helix-turn-helix domain-containing protein [Nocardiopsis]QUX24167.1 winged helix-turn-helix transcriptional regulator [Nocardiopsis changdeensis]QYX34562.1 helix-turn-helix domain-containing protein [Nocardiopsis sp. MT53]